MVLSRDTDMATKFSSSARHREALRHEWGRLATLVENAEKNPETKPVELVVLWRQLFGLCL
jgi:ribosomal protein L18E